MPADGLENQTKDWNYHPYLPLQDPSPFTIKCTTVILNVTTAHWKFRGTRFLDHSMMEPQKARKQGKSAANAWAISLANETGCHPR